MSASAILVTFSFRPARITASSTPTRPVRMRAPVAAGSGGRRRGAGGSGRGGHGPRQRGNEDMGIAYLQKTAPSLGRLAFRKNRSRRSWLARRASVGGFAPCAGRKLRRVQSWLARGGIYRPAASRQYGGTQTNAEDFHANPKTLRPDPMPGLRRQRRPRRGQDPRASTRRADGSQGRRIGHLWRTAIPVDVPDNAVKTRQQVLEERDAARAAGQITRGELDYPPVARKPPARPANRSSPKCARPAPRA